MKHLSAAGAAGWPIKHEQVLAALKVHGSCLQPLWEILRERLPAKVLFPACLLEKEKHADNLEDRLTDFCKKDHPEGGQITRRFKYNGRRLFHYGNIEPFIFIQIAESEKPGSVSVLLQNLRTERMDLFCDGLEPCRDAQSLLTDLCLSAIWAPARDRDLLSGADGADISNA